jgi:cell division septum initiation protein DivIVA
MRYLPEPEPVPAWEGAPPRFPIARHGYDCAVVDGHVAELEREITELDSELVELRRRSPSDNEVATEIQRVGEQTSAILLAAHDKAQETTRRAQAEADRCVADAAANALKITEEANQKARRIESETVSLRQERARLLEDIRTLGTTLCSMADDGAARFPVEEDSQPE